MISSICSVTIFLIFSVVTDTTTDAIEAPFESVPPSEAEPATLEVASTGRTEGGTLSVKVFDSRKCIFPSEEFANFDSFVNKSYDDGEGFLYPDLATVSS